MSLIQNFGNSCISTSNLETQVSAVQNIKKTPSDLEISDKKFNPSEKNIMT